MALGLIVTPFPQPQPQAAELSESGVMEEYTTFPSNHDASPLAPRFIFRHLSFDEEEDEKSSLPSHLSFAPAGAIARQGKIRNDGNQRSFKVS